jgi:hypothetical protein
MKKSLDDARRRIAADEAFAGFTVKLQDDELHLSRGDDSFVRLIPAEAVGQWRIEYFHNQKRWERIDFTGALEACLDLLGRSPQALYWKP